MRRSPRPMFLNLWMPFLFTIVLFLAAGSLTTNAQRADARPIQPLHQYALLIAAGDYPAASPYRRQQLEGPKNDVRLMASLLRWRFHFTPQEIRIIGANPQEWGETGQNIPVMSLLATYAEIQRGFVWLRSVARNTSDCVVIYYAGHGTRIYNADPKAAEVNGEALVPYDAQPDGVNYIRDTQIKVWLEAIGSQHKTVIVDTCYSGDIIRNIPDKTPGTKREDEPGEWISRGLGKKSPFDASKKHRPASTPLPTGTVLLAACAKNEAANEKRLLQTSPLLTETVTGEFTWALYWVLCHEQGAITPRTLRQHIADRLKQRGVKQEPQLLGVMPDLFALGCPVRSDARTVLPLVRTRTKTDKGREKILTLEIGWLAGLREGAALSLPDFPGKTVRVTQVGRFYSQVETELPLGSIPGHLAVERYP